MDLAKHVEKLTTQRPRQTAESSHRTRVALEDIEKINVDFQCLADTLETDFDETGRIEPVCNKNEAPSIRLTDKTSTGLPMDPKYT